MSPAGASRAVLLVNPASGRGRAIQAARALERELGARGVRAEIVHALGRDAGLADLLARRPGETGPVAGVVVGGDGTVNACLGAIRDAGAALYHYPLGTENLVARELGHVRDPRRAGEAIARARVRSLDHVRWRVVGPGLDERAHGLSLVMLGIGPDAGVVHRLSRERRGPITRGSYLRHVISELRSPSLARVSIDCDERPLVRALLGFVVVANMERYACRLNPARDADPTDGRLDCWFFPCDHSWDAVAWYGRFALRRSLDGARGARATRVVVECEADAPLQVDGDARAVVPGAGRLEAVVLPRSILVLDATPADPPPAGP